MYSGKRALNRFLRPTDQPGARDFAALAEGKTNKEVATDLNISPYTVETHRGHILQKLNLHNTAEIVLYAVRKGLLS